MDAAHPFEVPGYHLEALIGEGGFGQVWRARPVSVDPDAPSGRVAIKVLHLELIRSVDALTRFQRELDAIERLQHPNVVRGLGHGTLPDGRPYLILEYVEGPSLREVLHRRGALQPAEMLAILEPLCDALGAAHEAGLVHRDVKASNVILTRADDAGAPGPEQPEGLPAPAPADAPGSALPAGALAPADAASSAPPAEAPAPAEASVSAPLADASAPAESAPSAPVAAAADDLAAPTDAAELAPAAPVAAAVDDPAAPAGSTPALATDPSATADPLLAAVPFIVGAATAPPAPPPLGPVRPVLLDFGLVKLVDQVGPGLTSSRFMLGTPAAMAPEQMRGQAVDARTDIYALGLLAFHMLTGQPAFGGAPGVVQSYLVVHGPRPRPSSKVDIDPAIDEPIARALAPEPSARFPNARAFGEALRAVIHGAAGHEIEVTTLYVEGDESDVLAAIEIARSAGLTIALTAPDSMLAVAPRARIDVATLRSQVSSFSGQTGVAIGISRATISGQLVDGPALDVEGWAPYPLPTGLWVADGL